MPPANPKFDLSPGSIIHIEGYVSGGFAPKDKFLIVLGQHDSNTVLAFLLTSNPEYQATYRARELVPVPAGSIRTLSKDCWIQCFNEIHRLEIAELAAGFQKGKVKSVGSLADFLGRIKTIVEVSDVLSQSDIEDTLRVLEIALKNPK